MTAWLDDGDVRLYHGSAIDVLRTLPAASVQTCVTSPPYYGLRDYGTAEWTGGDAECDHLQKVGGTGASTLGAASGGNDMSAAARERSTTRSFVPYAVACGKCGAQRVDAQLGLEATPQDYVASLVAVFAEVWRVLRADGTLWVNLGDSYAGSGKGAWDVTDVQKEVYVPKPGGAEASVPKVPSGLKAKDLVGVPWKVAFALQEAGWYLRSDIIWSKPNPMPESVTDRPTKAHEYLFLLTKQPRYFYDADAIREPHQWEHVGATRLGARSKNGGSVEAPVDGKGNTTGSFRAFAEGGRNARSVWEIATQPTPEAHFATFPEALVRRCILAGTSERGGCAVCGALDPAPGVTPGWAPSCACGAPPVPQTVLDPFVGSGTTALVARKHGRRAIGIDLSAEYLGIAARRLGQQSLFA